MKKSDFLYLFLYYLLKFVFKILPKKLIKKLANLIAKIAFKLNKKHRKIIDVNLSICFPKKTKEQRDEISLKIYENFAKFGLDFLANQNINKDEIQKKVQVEDLQDFKAISNSGRKLVFSTAHYGNWELLSLFYSANFKKISIVVRMLDSEVMNKIVAKNRAQFDIELINKKGGLKQMLKVLKNDRVLGILTDQNATENEGLKLKFFNKDIIYLSGASVIAKKSSALLVPVFIYQKDDKYIIKHFKAMDSKDFSVEELTKYQAACLEQMIKFKPDEYFFFHKRFKSSSENPYE